MICLVFSTHWKRLLQVVAPGFRVVVSQEGSSPFRWVRAGVQDSDGAVLVPRRTVGQAPCLPEPVQLGASQGFLGKAPRGYQVPDSVSFSSVLSCSPNEELRLPAAAGTGAAAATRVSSARLESKIRGRRWGLASAEPEPGAAG